MASPSTDTAHTPSTQRLQDHRTAPHGVLPRRIQTWLMAGLAAVIVLIILITGHSAPAQRTAAVAGPAPTPATADRIRGYQRQLEDEQRRQTLLEQQQAAIDGRTAAPASARSPQTSDAVVEDQHRREVQSLFADNVAFTRRAAAVTRPPVPLPPIVAGSQPGATNVAAPSSSDAAPAERSVATAPTSTTEQRTREYPAPGPRLRLLEGTVIETALVNRLDGTFTGPVDCLVTTPVYSHDRQHIVIPAGARVVGESAAVQNWGESRLAVTFHRLLMPDGHTYNLDRFKGLDQIGATGLRDQVNRHYLQVFGASIAIGAIAGLAQFNTRTGIDYTFSDAYRQAAGASLATSSSRVLDRYLNALPTITIREGFRIKVYLTNDLELPPYVDEDDK